MLTMILKDLRISPARSILTSISMFVGIIAVICSSLVGTIGQSYLEATNAQLSGRAPTYAVSVDGGIPRNADDLESLCRAMQRITNGAVAPVFNTEGLTIMKTATSGTLIPESVVEPTMTTSDYSSVYALPISSGRWFSGDSVPSSLEIVTNKPGAQTYGSVGDSVSITSKTSLNVVNAHIIGIVNDGSSEPRLYVNALSFSLLEPQLWSPSSFTMYWHPSNGTLPAERVQGAISDILHDSTGGETNNAQRADNADSYETVVHYISIGFLACAGLLLLVAVIGLINIGLAEVDQRSHELLIRRALGASKGNIIALVAGSSIVLSCLVAIVAIVISVILVFCIPYWLPVDTPIDPPPFPVATAAYAFGASLVTAFIGSIAPATKAARLEPALALR
jgi:putative ABC transport system permease protein